MLIPGASGLAYPPRQAMVALLMRGLNLIRPLAVPRGLWNAGAPRHPVGAAWRQARTSAHVHRGWTRLVAEVAADVAPRRLALRSGGFLDFGPGVRMSVVGPMLAAAAAVVGPALALGVGTPRAAARERAADGEPG